MQKCHESIIKAASIKFNIRAFDYKFRFLFIFPGAFIYLFSFNKLDQLPQLKFISCVLNLRSELLYGFPSKMNWCYKVILFPLHSVSFLYQVPQPYKAIVDAYLLFICSIFGEMLSLMLILHHLQAALHTLRSQC